MGLLYPSGMKMEVAKKLPISETMFTILRVMGELKSIQQFLFSKHGLWDTRNGHHLLNVNTMAVD